MPRPTRDQIRDAMMRGDKKLARRLLAKYKARPAVSPDDGANVTTWPSVQPQPHTEDVSFSGGGQTGRLGLQRYLRQPGLTPRLPTDISRPQPFTDASYGRATETHYSRGVSGFKNRDLPVSFSGSRASLVVPPTRPQAEGSQQTSYRPTTRQGPLSGRPLPDDLDPRTQEYVDAAERFGRYYDRSERKLADVDPRLRDAIRATMYRASTTGSYPTVTEGYRSPERQNELYARGRTGPGSVVTNRRGTESEHSQRRAVDLAFLDRMGRLTYKGDWPGLGAISEALGLEWGGRGLKFSDRPHFQLPNNGRPYIASR